MALKVQASKFALLKVEDCYDSDDQEASDKEQIQKAQPIPVTGAKKKKNKNKKNPDIGSGQKFEHLRLAQGDQPRGTCGKNKVISESEWEEWEKLDREYAAGEFEKDLNDAVINSRLKYEELKQKEEADAKKKLNSLSGKKKKKDKSITMTLNQFSQASVRDLHPRADLRLESKPIQKTCDALNPVKNHAVEVMNRRREEAAPTETRNAVIVAIENGYQATEDALELQKRKKELNLKDKEIIMLTATRKKLEEDLQQVKKRNQQLLHMSGQGEMKEKTPILTEIENLKQIGEELKNDLDQRKSELDAERSNVLLLKAEVDKLKGIKHGGK